MLDWWVRNNSPAELVSFVDLQSEVVWMLRHEEVQANRLHVDQPLKDDLHFGFYIDPAYTHGAKSFHKSDFEKFEMERRIEDLFGSSKIQAES